jgi:hypothetical protein
MVVPVLTNPSVWGSFRGWTTGAANAAPPQCGDPDLTSLIAEYPGENSKKERLQIDPVCEDFAKDGAGSVKFTWNQLSGHVPEAIGNYHQWAMVRNSLRDGLDAIWAYDSSLVLVSAYRNPKHNRVVGGIGRMAIFGELARTFKIRACRNR